MKDVKNMVNNINKLGGVKSSLLDSGRARIKRLAEHYCAWLAAFVVSACLVGCSENEAEKITPPTPATADETRTETSSPADSTNTLSGVITDWEDGKAGGLQQITEEEYNRRMNH